MTKKGDFAVIINGKEVLRTNDFNKATETLIKKSNSKNYDQKILNMTKMKQRLIEKYKDGSFGDGNDHW